MPLVKYRVILFLLLFNISSLILCARAQNNEPPTELYTAACRHIDSGIKYLNATCRKETDSLRSFKGEWPASMCLQKGFLLLGKKKEVDDSNCFSVSSIHNSLARIYLEYPEYELVLPLLDASFQNILSYKNGPCFNFWPLLPPNRDLKKGDDVNNQPLVRRPTNYPLKSRYINNAANVTEDADDTGLAYTANALRKKIYEKHDLTDTLCFDAASISSVFDGYRDQDRKNRHWYNYINCNDHNTGAYLTWLGSEYQFRRWNIVKVLGHNATFYLPFSECYPHAYIPYIPYGSNDLDGVVNANVLSALAVNNALDAQGVQSAIKFIERKSKRQRYDRVGIYYPNRYQFPYAVSEAYAQGVPGLDTAAEYIIDYLKKTQNKDGSWASRRVINKKDVLQSTAYALNTLINFGEFDNRATLVATEKAIRFLMAHSKKDAQGIHWKGGVFFSGGTVVRNALVWKSDAYTTVIILKAFAGYRKYFELKYNIAYSK